MLKASDGSPSTVDLSRGGVRPGGGEGAVDPVPERLRISGLISGMPTFHPVELTPGISM